MVVDEKHTQEDEELELGHYPHDSEEGEGSEVLH